MFFLCYAALSTICFSHFLQVFIHLFFLTSAVRLWTTLLSDVSSCHRPSLWCQKPTCNRLVNGDEHFRLRLLTNWMKGAAARAVFGRSPDTADAGRWESRADLTPRSIERQISALAALNLRWEVDLWMQKWPQLVKKPDHLGKMWVYCIRASLLQIANQGCGRTDQGALPLWINSSPPSC